MNNLPAYVMRKHLTATNKIMRKEHIIKGLSKMKSVDIKKMFLKMFKKDKKGDPELKESFWNKTIDIDEISDITKPIYRKYIKSKKKTKKKSRSKK